MRRQGKHDDDASRTSGYWEGERIKGLLVELLVRYRRLICLLLLMRVGALLIEQRPSHRGQHETTGELHDGEGDAEEGEQGGSDELDDQQEEDGVDSNSAREAAVDLRRSRADEPIEDECRAERIHQRQQRTEGDP